MNLFFSYQCNIIVILLFPESDSAKPNSFFCWSHWETVAPSAVITQFLLCLSREGPDIARRKCCGQKKNPRIQDVFHFFSEIKTNTCFFSAALSSLKDSKGTLFNHTRLFKHSSE